MRLGPHAAALPHRGRWLAAYGYAVTTGRGARAAAEGGVWALEREAIAF